MTQKPSGTSAVSKTRRGGAGRLQMGLLAIAFAAGLSPVSSPAMAQSGDMNCDGAVTIDDIPLFVEALLATGGFSGCDINRADMNLDTLINGRDTQGFVAALLAPQCPVGSTLCGGVCVDTAFNNGHCGSCGHACAFDEVCIAGACYPSEPCWDCGP